MGGQRVGDGVGGVAHEHVAGVGDGLAAHVGEAREPAGQLVVGEAQRRGAAVEVQHRRGDGAPVLGRGVEAERAAASGGAIFKPKMSIAPHGFIALVNDTEGNLIGLHSMA